MFSKAFLVYYYWLNTSQINSLLQNILNQRQYTKTGEFKFFNNNYLKLPLVSFLFNILISEGGKYNDDLGAFTLKGLK